MIDSRNEAVEWASVAAPVNVRSFASPASSVEHWRAMHRQGYFSDHRKYRDRHQSDGIAQLLGLIGPTPDDEALEIGCGYGRVLCRLAPHVRRAVGVDIADQPLDEARAFLTEHTNVELVRTDGVSLASFADDSFDVVLSVTVFQHLPRAAVDRYLAEIVRVLRPAGRVCVQFMTGGDPDFDIVDEPTEQSTSWTASQIAALAERHGLNVERIEREIVDHPQFDWYWLLATTPVE